MGKGEGREGEWDSTSLLWRVHTDPQSPLWMPLIDATALEGRAMLVMWVVLRRLAGAPQTRLLCLPAIALGAGLSQLLPVLG